MSFYSNVAPPKIPLKPMPKAWTCACPARSLEEAALNTTATRGHRGATTVRQVNPGYLARCNGCGMRRPT